MFYFLDMTEIIMYFKVISRIKKPFKNLKTIVGQTFQTGEVLI